jgi:head-tail adaptor
VIKVYTLTGTVNDQGEEIKAYTTSFNINGIVLPVSGREIILNGKETVIADSILICEVAVLKNTDRIIYNSKTYEIIYIENDPRAPVTFAKFMKVYVKNIV